MGVASRLGIAFLLLAVGCAQRESKPPPTLDALFPSGRRTESLLKLADSETLAAGEGFRLREIGRDANSSHHLVWIRDREQPHRHDHHDLFVVILRGHGFMRIGDEEREVGEGSILYIPRGTPHAFRNTSGAVAITYAVYTPAFDGVDRVPVE